MQARIDQNDKPTLLAYNETTGIVEPIRVDPVLGYVEVFAVPYVPATYSSLQNAKIDGNDQPTMIGYNETTGKVEALRCGSNGELIVIAA